MTNKSNLNKNNPVGNIFIAVGLSVAIVAGLGGCKDTEAQSTPPPAVIEELPGSSPIESPGENPDEDTDFSDSSEIHFDFDVNNLGGAINEAGRRMYQHPDEFNASINERFAGVDMSMFSEREQRYIKYFIEYDYGLVGYDVVRLEKPDANHFKYLVHGYDQEQGVFSSASPEFKFKEDSSWENWEKARYGGAPKGDSVVMGAENVETSRTDNDIWNSPEQVAEYNEHLTYADGKIAIIDGKEYSINDLPDGYIIVPSPDDSAQGYHYIVHPGIYGD